MTYTANILGASGTEVIRDGVKTQVFRINAGCGKAPFQDCCNVDMAPNVGADVVCDFGNSLPFPDNTFDSVYCSHTLEHIIPALHFMQELHRVCVHGAVGVFLTPYGSSDNAWEDPTHVRPYYLDSFGYFSQAAYDGADYGYRGDWAQVERVLRIRKGLGLETLKDKLEDLLGYVMSTRNIVEEMKVIIRAVKPIRVPGTFKEEAPIKFHFYPVSQTVTAANDATSSKH